MSFRTNESQQIDLFDSVNNLTKREQEILVKSWAENFRKIVFPQICEEPFKVLYSDGVNSRPNTPVNILIGLLILKEMHNLTDEELMAELTFDVRYQHALNTTSFQEQPSGLRTISRFREKALKHYMETGEDLLENEMKRISGAFAKMMGIDSTIKRMDSLMISTNAKIMGRLELIYTCTEMAARLVQRVAGEEYLTANLCKYLEEGNHNAVCYHAKDDESRTRLEQALSDAQEIYLLCGKDYEEFKEYQNLKRVLQEQAKIADGKYVLKENHELSAKNMQTPHDTDATYRKKAGEKHVGYVANIVEEVGEEGSIITDFAVEPNVYSDTEFAKDVIEATPKQEEPITMVADGAYHSEEALQLGEEKNIRLITTSLTGIPTDEIVLEFQVKEGAGVEQCPAGETPIRQEYNEEKEEYTCWFEKEACEKCPNKERCHVTIQKKGAKVKISKKQINRAKHQKGLKEGAYKEQANLRNGVEGVPSILRRRYNVDNIPVFGLVRLRMWVSLKIGAINAKRIIQFAS